MVTLMVPDVLTSDPLSTALSVLGPKEGSKLLQAYRSGRHRPTRGCCLPIGADPIDKLGR